MKNESNGVLGFVLIEHQINICFTHPVVKKRPKCDTQYIKNKVIYIYTLAFVHVFYYDLVHTLLIRLRVRVDLQGKNIYVIQTFYYIFSGVVVQLNKPASFEIS